MKFPVFPSIFTIAAIPAVQAAGFFLPNQGTVATARGNAWVATADSPAAVHYNPAGLTQLDAAEVEFGLYGIVLGNKATIAGESFEAERELQIIPHLFYGQPINEKLSVGLGITTPFGLGTDWGNTPFRQTTLSANITNIRASGVAAYQLTDTLSIGGGIALNFAKASLRNGFAPFDPSGPNADLIKFKGDDLALSWNIGLLWQPHPRHSFGLTYRSLTDFTLDGDLEGNVLPESSASASISTPESAAIGYAFQATDKLSIEANIEWINWERLDALTIGFPGGALPSQRFDWDATFVYEIGLSYQVNDRYTFHCGYDFNENAQPASTYTPAVADADRHWINAGLSYYGDRITWDIGYQYGFSTRTINGAGNPAVDGRYEADHHAFLISTRTTF